MYKIYQDGELIWTNETPDVGIYSAKLTLEANNTNSLEINVAKTSNAFSNLKMLQSVIQVYQDNETDPIFEGRPISKKVDYQGNADYKFEGALGYLYDSIQPPVDYTGLTPETILKALIKEHNSQVEPYKQFTVGDITIIDNTESDTYTGVGRLHDDDVDKDPAYIYQYDSNKTGINQTDLTTGYESTFDAINNLLINNLSGNLVVRFQNGVKYLDYLEKYLPSEGQVILFGSNLLDYSSTLDYSSICTGVLPLGYSRGSDDYEPGDPNNPDDPSNMYQKENDPLQTVKSKLTIESVNSGSKILWDQNMVNTYGRIVKAVEWSNCKDANKLLDKAKAYLYKKQYDNLALECKIIDLHFVNTDSKPLHHMHMVEVKSEPHSLDRMMPINKMDLDLMNPANDTISLGQTYNSLTGEFAGTKNDVSNLSGTTSNISQTIENNVKTAWTNIQQTDDAITLEAENRDKAVRAALKVTADQISSEVSNLKTSIASVARQTPTSFSWGFEDAGGGKESLVLYKNTEDGTVGYKVDLDEFIMNVLKHITITTPRIDISTGPSNSSTIQNGIISTTNQVFGKQFIAMSDVSSTSSGGTGTATMYGQSTIKYGTISGGIMRYDREIRMNSGGYDEDNKWRSGIRFDDDIFCGDYKSMVATRKWVTENFKDGYIKKDAVGVNTTITGSGVESKYPTYAKMRDRKNQLADWVQDLRAQVRAGCKKGTTPVH